MPVPTDITAGTISISGSTVTGVGTSFVASGIRQGDLFIWIEGGAGEWSPIVQTVTSNTVLTLAEPWTGPTISGARYRLRYQWDSSRVSAQSRQLIEMLDNGNVLALAGLTGPGVPVFDGPHSMTIRPETDFTRGVEYDVQVDTLTDRAAYDGQAAGYTVLVSDVGDGRSAVYSKASNASGDWTDPAYVTGPVGPLPGVEATVATGAPGSAATVDEVPITGGVRLDFTLPAAEGFYNAGVYSSGTAYNKDQVVRHNGSSFIALQAVPAGTSPSNAFPPIDTAFWQVLAAKGQDGAGTGDVAGPSGSISDRIAVFDGTTGKLIKDGGATIASLGDVNGPASAVNNRIAVFDGTTGKLIKDGGVTIAGITTVVPGHIYGLTISNNATFPGSDIDVAIGEATSSDGTTLIRLTSGFSKGLGAPWSAGSGSTAGMRDTGSISDGTWHVFVIYNPTTSTSDVLASLSPTAPTLPSGYTKFRRIGSLLRVSGSILAFKQYGDMFKLDAQVIVRNSVTPVVDTLLAMSVPTGLRLSPIFVADMQMNTAGTGVQIFSDGDRPTAEVGANRVAAANEYASNIVSQAFITNTAGQLRFTLLLPTGSLIIARVQTQGWFDPRGK